MFYHGGMTLGYLTPPAKREKASAAKPAIAPREDEIDISEHERDKETSRAFLTPWHLFY